MNEGNQVLDRIIAWGHAHAAVRDNTNLLLKNWEANHELCAHRMKVLEEAENEMLALSGRTDLPPALVRYINAKDDSGCSQCWYSSRHNLNHPDCQAKIQEYFLAREHLEQFALQQSKSS